MWTQTYRVNMLTQFCLGLICAAVTACGGGSADNETMTSDEFVAPPIVERASVYRDSVFNVEAELDLVYGQGNTSTEWLSSDTVPTNLLLDVYLPINDETRRPAMIFIHGGGFRGGDKRAGVAMGFPRYFAERGFVGASINYRVLGEYGSIPEALNEAVDSTPGFSADDRDQLKAMYPATRDAKAAIRWLTANADSYGIDPDAISVVGGSAGSFIAVALGATRQQDFRDELTEQQDATLTTTNLDQDFDIQAVVAHWGGPGTVTLLDGTYNLQSWDETDAPLSIIHGTEDRVVSFDQGEALLDLYQNSGAYYEFYPLQGAGHSAWDFVYEGQTLEELAFDFISGVLELNVELN